MIASFLLSQLASHLQNLNSRPSHEGFITQEIFDAATLKLKKLSLSFALFLGLMILTIAGFLYAFISAMNRLELSGHLTWTPSIVGGLALMIVPAAILTVMTFSLRDVKREARQVASEAKKKAMAASETATEAPRENVYTSPDAVDAPAATASGPIQILMQELAWEREKNTARPRMRVVQ